jgi:hypothetical protein
MNYTYSILGLRKKTIGEHSDVVCGITWRKIGIDDNGYQGKCDTYDDLGIDETNVDQFVGSGFINYSNLTESNIISWIETSRSQEEINLKIEEDINSQMIKGIEVSDGSLPWQ